MPLDETRCPKCFNYWPSVQSIPIPKEDLKLHPCMLLHGPSGHGGQYADLYFAQQRGDLKERGSQGSWEDLLQRLEGWSPERNRRRLEEIDQYIADL